MLAQITDDWIILDGKPNNGPNDLYLQKGSMIFIERSLTKYQKQTFLRR